MSKRAGLTECNACAKMCMHAYVCVCVCLVGEKDTFQSKYRVIITLYVLCSLSQRHCDSDTALKEAGKLLNGIKYLYMASTARSLIGSFDNRHPRKGENHINKLDVTVCCGAFIYIFKECFNLSSVFGQETAEVSFTFDLTSLNNDFVTLWSDH